MRRVVSIICYALAGFFFGCTCLMAFAWTADETAKWLVLGFQLLPASVFLSLGRVLSPERVWTREVGIVLLSAAAFGLFVVLTMSLMFMEPAFQESMQGRHTEFFNDYVTGTLWILLMGTLGGSSLLVSRKQVQSPQKKSRAPIIGH